MRKAKPKKKPTQADLDYQALERENLKLQREIAALKAQLVSERHRKTAEYEDRTIGGMSEKDWDAVRDHMRQEAQRPHEISPPDDTRRNA